MRLYGHRGIHVLLSLEGSLFSVPYPMSTGANPLELPQFRARRRGPEAVMQDIVAGQIPGLFSPSPNFGTAVSVPLGTGIPDLVVVSYCPQVFADNHKI